MGDNSDRYPGKCHFKCAIISWQFIGGHLTRVVLVTRIETQGPPRSYHDADSEKAEMFDGDVFISQGLALSPDVSLGIAIHPYEDVERCSYSQTKSFDPIRSIWINV